MYFYQTCTICCPIIRFLLLLIHPRNFNSFCFFILLEMKFGIIFVVGKYEISFSLIIQVISHNHKTKLN